MYCPNVVSLKQFYAGELGQVAAGCIWRRLHRLWPEAANEATLGLGYAVPYLRADAQAVAAMPAGQGALYWPVEAKNRATLLDESRLPFADNSFNRVLLVHALEHSEHLTAMMQEIWRVLTPGGRMLALAPNRMGIWSRSTKSPFGSGRPFSARQLRELAAASGLTVTRMDSTLFLPPTHMRWLLKAMPKLELLGHILCPLMGGVLLLEAEKQIYAALKEPVWARGRTVISPVAAQPAFN